VNKVYQEIAPAIVMKVEVRSPKRKRYEEEYNKYLMDKYNND
jgi:hypothetical protein